MGFRINKYYSILTHLFYADDSLIFFEATPKDCQAINQILKTYERARQTINFEKSLFMTSKNTNENMIEYIQRELQDPFTIQLGKY